MDNRFVPINMENNIPRPQNPYVERQQEKQRKLLRRNTKIDPQEDPFRKLKANMSVQHLVTEFNHLTRSPLSPFGQVRNVWNISIRHVPLQPESDVLFLVLDNGAFVHAAGPARLLHITSAIERADIVLPMLLKSFTTAYGTDALPVAPWSWNIRESMLAQSLELAFQALGLRKDLAKIQVATDEENAAADREWAKFRMTLLRTVATPLEELPKLPPRKRGHSF